MRAICLPSASCGIACCSRPWVRRMLRQIDGVGGAHPLTSKVAVISRSTRAARRRRLSVPAGRRSTRPRSATARTAATSSPASDRGPSRTAWCRSPGTMTPVRIHMVNTRASRSPRADTPNGAVRIRRRRAHRRRAWHRRADPAGVSRRRRIELRRRCCPPARPWMRSMASSHVHRQRHAGRRPARRGFRSDRRRDAGAARSNATLKARSREPSGSPIGPAHESRRCDEEDGAEDVPGVSAPRHGGAIATRTFIPHRVHEAIGVFGAVSVATACMTPGSVAAQVAKLSGDSARSASTSSIPPDSSPSTWRSNVEAGT